MVEKLGGRAMAVNNLARFGARAETLGRGAIFKAKS